MAREIKFRAWDKNGKDMYFNVQNGIRFTDLSHYTFRDFLGNPEAIGDCHDWEVMQYTGLKDKNGKEIYEGDIVEYFFNQEKVVESVEYDLCDAGFTPFTNYCYEDKVIIRPEENVEVIGNIYENPELLKFNTTKKWETV